MDILIVLRQVSTVEKEICSQTNRTVVSLVVTLSICLGLLAAAFVLQSQESTPSSSSKEETLRTFLQRYVEEKSEPPLDTLKVIRFSNSFVDLNGDGKEEAIVFLADSTGWFCGSGGCVMLVLEAKGSSYRIVTKTTVTRQPIRVLSSVSHGWHSIGVWVAGGGILEGYEAELDFDGTSYPTSPTTAPRSSGKAAGEVVIPFLPLKDRKQLYPDGP